MLLSRGHHLKDLSLTVEAARLGAAVTLSPGRPMVPGEFMLVLAWLSVGEEGLDSEPFCEMVVTALTTLEAVVAHAAEVTSQDPSRLCARAKRGSRVGEVSVGVRTMQELFGVGLKDGATLTLQCVHLEEAMPHPGSMVLAARRWDASSCEIGQASLLACPSTPEEEGGAKGGAALGAVVGAVALLSGVPSEAVRVAKVLPYQIRDTASLKYAAWRGEAGKGAKLQAGDTVLWLDFREAEVPASRVMQNIGGDK